MRDKRSTGKKVIFSQERWTHHGIARELLGHIATHGLAQRQRDTALRYVNHEVPGVLLFMWLKQKYQCRICRGTEEGIMSETMVDIAFVVKYSITEHH